MQNGNCKNKKRKMENDKKEKWKTQKWIKKMENGSKK